MKKVALTKKRTHTKKEKPVIKISSDKLHHNEEDAKLIELESYNYFGEWYGQSKKKAA